VNAETPVLVLKLVSHGGIGVVRTLGRLGVPVYAVNSDASAPAAASRYIRAVFEYDLDAAAPAEAVAHLLELAERIGSRPLLITSDDAGETLVSKHSEELGRRFAFPHRPGGLSERLLSKRGLYEACQQHGIPTPLCRFPQTREEALDAIEAAQFPLMLKAIDNVRFTRRNQMRMFIARDPEEAIGAYDRLEDPAAPNLMLQAHIPGASGSVWVYTGYFDNASECRFGAGGLKLRQFPIRTGTTCFGVVRSDPEMEALTKHFVKELGYRGVFDCGYRYDPRDGVYKMLDVNPRVGLNFRQCVGRGDLDVVRAMYLDLTAQEVPASQPAEGRVWWVEDYDIRAGMAHVRERSLTARAWMGSLRQVDEPAWFARDDLAPFRRLVRQLVAKASRRILTRTGLGAWRGQGRPGKDASGPVRYSTRASTRC
jgi:predicted ATP-grasp superfamily ATP-dependent carboligase